MDLSMQIEPNRLHTPPWSQPSSVVPHHTTPSPTDSNSSCALPPQAIPTATTLDVGYSGKHLWLREVATARVLRQHRAPLKACCEAEGLDEDVFDPASARYVEEFHVIEKMLLDKKDYYTASGRAYVDLTEEYQLYATRRRRAYNKMFPDLAFGDISGWLSAEWQVLKDRNDVEVQYWNDLETNLNAAFERRFQGYSWSHNSAKIQDRKKGRVGSGGDLDEAHDQQQADTQNKRPRVDSAPVLAHHDRPLDGPSNLHVDEPAPNPNPLIAWAHHPGAEPAPTPYVMTEDEMAALLEEMDADPALNDESNDELMDMFDADLYEKLSTSELGVQV
ncbi:hypothetical protein IAR55_003665 [Kwoniella newhampshirensis]|uniref:HMG box domain-containing protein n=1 Tax=Kwoniella newhampshirensis TaxID=1651941 RepID=A0AAW0YZI1_9TREE